MTEFTVCVELRGLGQNDYALLNAKLAEAGYSHTVEGTDDSGKRGTWELPTGVYSYKSETLSAADVRQRVKEIAAEITNQAWVVVTGVQGRSWSTRRLKSAG